MIALLTSLLNTVPPADALPLDTSAAHEARCVVLFDVDAEGVTENICSVCALERSEAGALRRGASSRREARAAVEAVIEQYELRSANTVAEWRYTSANAGRLYVLNQFDYAPAGTDPESLAERLPAMTWPTRNPCSGSEPSTNN